MRSYKLSLTIYLLFAANVVSLRGRRRSTPETLEEGAKLVRTTAKRKSTPETLEEGAKLVRTTAKRKSCSDYLSDKETALQKEKNVKTAEARLDAWKQEHPYEGRDPTMFEKMVGFVPEGSLRTFIKEHVPESSDARQDIRTLIEEGKESQFVAQYEREINAAKEEQQIAEADYSRCVQLSAVDSWTGYKNPSESARKFGQQWLGKARETIEARNKETGGQYRSFVTSLEVKGPFYVQKQPLSTEVTPELLMDSIDYAEEAEFPQEVKNCEDTKNVPTSCTSGDDLRCHCVDQKGLLKELEAFAVSHNFEAYQANTSLQAQSGNWFTGTRNKNLRATVEKLKEIKGKLQMNFNPDTPQHWIQTKDITTDNVAVLFTQLYIELKNQVSGCCTKSWQEAIDAKNATIKEVVIKLQEEMEKPGWESVFSEKDAKTYLREQLALHLQSNLQLKNVHEELMQKVAFQQGLRDRSDGGI